MKLIIPTKSRVAVWSDLAYLSDDDFDRVKNMPTKERLAYTKNTIKPAVDAFKKSLGRHNVYTRDA